MLPKSVRQAYHSLLKTLLILQQHLEAKEPDVTGLQAIFEEIEQIFAAKILPLTSLEAPLELPERWQSIQTEIHRDWRLLRTDFLFWRTSSQRATAKTRLTLLKSRLARLIDYCQILDGEDKNTGVD
ncbi:heterocyst frequency control protein PatD [Gloeothece verrucosa]|uniref:Heterocyst frequency control protein PatD n=1 Tax=Gloeothece verrucosa (strain PCC 7822) TaxID=497965 RepID=E0U836_GLOV7|nr:heterocyst frequency control protein PatD [Gloeothece verrucosa]ADN17241.1 conserved hypothetical protein [Gloeothece verrucosa PCC 7822]